MAKNQWCALAKKFLVYSTNARWMVAQDSIMTSTQEESQDNIFV